MPILLIILVVLLLVLGPQLWIRWVFFRYGVDRPGMPGTGGELAKHLLKRFDIDNVSVEETDPWRDHFDGHAGAVRLSPRNYHGKSLTAIAVAAHEVGHAIQWHRRETVFRLRERYLPTAIKLQRIGFALLSFSPIIGLLTRHPIGLAVPIIAGLVIAFCGAATYLIILPEEWDASFNKAMPILIEGHYVSSSEEPVVRKILRAAALTYVAGALASLLQIWRWLPLILRR